MNLGGVKNSVESRSQWFSQGGNGQSQHMTHGYTHAHACLDQTEHGLGSETTLLAIKSDVIGPILAEIYVLPKSEKSAQCLIKGLLTRVCAACRE